MPWKKLLKAPSLRRVAAAWVIAAGVAGGAVPTRADTARRPPPEARPQSPDFGPVLARLGEWVRLRTDERAWRPSAVAADWQPYRAGEWAWTSEGWFWVSSEPWAWATYHYGEWRFDPSFGWVWLPGDTWRAAHVVWRYGGGVVGWAPRSRGGVLLPSHWTFVPASPFAGVPVSRTEIRGGRAAHAFASTRVVSTSAGPRAPDEGSTSVQLPVALAAVTDAAAAAGAAH